MIREIDLSREKEEFRIGFIVSDSRSGSTLLASRISSALHGVVVTPELRFIRLFSIPDATLAKMSPERVMRLLTADEQLRNLDATPADLIQRLSQENGRPFTKERLLRAVLRLHLGGEEAAANWVLVKAGNHILHWRAIREAFPGAPFVYCLRDARAVVNSKLRTRRPYAPWETLGWSGSFVLALRWGHYVRAAMEADLSGTCVVWVRYEEFVCDTESVLKRVAVSLGVAVSADGGKSNYAIPLAERGIHKLADSKVAIESRADAWRQELRRWDRICVEVLAKPVMSARGYGGYLSASRKEVGLALFCGAFKSAAGIILHFSVSTLRTVWCRLHRRSLKVR